MRFYLFTIGGREYRLKETEKHNKVFLDKLTSIRPYYNSQEWERDAEKRKGILKIMRKVKYKSQPRVKHTFSMNEEMSVAIFPYQPSPVKHLDSGEPDDEFADGNKCVIPLLTAFASLTVQKEQIN